MTKSLFDVFREAMERKPAASRKEALDYFVTRMKAEPVYIEELAVDYFHRMSSTWTVRDEKHGYAFGRTVDIKAARQRRAQSAARRAAVLADLKAKVRAVILLDLTLPNGKALRHATGAECAKAGGFYAAVARHIKPTQVVDRHLTEADLQAISARHFGFTSTTRKAAQ